MYNFGNKEKPNFDNEISKLYLLAEKRCKALMANDEYRRNIESAHSHEEILSKGYFQGFFEALLLIHEERQN